MLCPITRALDAVGDRWELLILRDLHAGPARFKDLQKSLVGIASNLLTDRLVKLTDQGLIKRYQDPMGVTLYALTPLGEKTRSLLLELALLGSHFPPEPDLKPMTSHRTIAVTLAALLERVAGPQDHLTLQLIVEEETFCVEIDAGRVRVVLGLCSAPQATARTTYKALLAVGDGLLSPEAFAMTDIHLQSGSAATLQHFLSLMGRAIAYLTPQAGGN
ncbi:winged helix-turn-helix transcriptional regulator [Rhodovibrionaceae bacterium A322]